MTLTLKSEAHEDEDPQSPSVENNDTSQAETDSLKAPANIIPGSFWGDPEAGLTTQNGRVVLHIQHETPLHSALHEAAHAVCMDPERRAILDTDAGGTDIEECGVCYLQILWAASLPGISLDRAWRDLDDWGYSFRLGSARAWFERDAADARAWLVDHHILISETPLKWAPRSLSPHPR